MKPPRARMGFPALGWIPGHTTWGHLLINVTVDADTKSEIWARRMVRKRDLSNVAAIDGGWGRR